MVFYFFTYTKTFIGPRIVNGQNIFLLTRFLEDYLKEDDPLSLQRRKIKYNFLVLLKLAFNFRMPRSIWMKPRYKGWWIFFKQRAHPEMWNKRFRMSQETFKYVHDNIQMKLTPKYNPLQPDRAIGSEEQVAICIYFLSSCAEYRVIGDVFGYEKSTICKVVRKVVNALLDILAPLWITLPDANETRQISAAFEARCCVPGMLFALDATHIPVHPSTVGRLDFFNRKGWASIILQALVDHKPL